MKDSKVKSSKTTPMVKGGGKGMFGKGGATPMPAGQTGKSSQGGPSKFKGGGSGKMFGKQSASPAPAGRTGK